MLGRQAGANRGFDRRMSNHALTHEPQLRMYRPGLYDLPPLDLPAGYVLRHYRPGDDAGLSEVFRDAFGWEDMDFCRFFSRISGFMPARSLLIAHGDEIVANALLLYEPNIPAARRSGTAFLHWVASKSSHAGKKLGYFVSLAVLHRMLHEGYRAAGLGTDDARLPAIKTYLNLGFTPRLVHENQPDRWRKIFDALAMPELKDQFADLLDGPIYPF